MVCLLCMPRGPGSVSWGGGGVTQQYEMVFMRRHFGDKTMPAFTDKEATNARCTFITVAVSGALPPYQNLRSDSPTKPAPGNNNQNLWCVSVMSAFTRVGGIKNKNPALTYENRERLTDRHNLPRSLGCVLGMKDKEKGRGWWMLGRRMDG